MSTVKFKRYKIVYAPRIKVEQLAVNPLNDWDTANNDGEYVLVQVHNHDNRHTESVFVDAPNKTTATALFAVYIAGCVPLGKVCDFAPETLVIDAVNHIVDITEVAE